jgi:hypothetical protein
MPEVRAPVAATTSEVAAFRGESPSFTETFGDVLDAALALTPPQEPGDPDEGG